MSEATGFSSPVRSCLGLLHAVRRRYENCPCCCSSKAILAEAATLTWKSKELHTAETEHVQQVVGTSASADRRIYSSRWPSHRNFHLPRSHSGSDVMPTACRSSAHRHRAQLVRNAEAPCGIEGSVFHTGGFTRDPRGISGLSRTCGSCWSSSTMACRDSSPRCVGP